MLNGITGASAVCCAMPQNGYGVGAELPDGIINVGGVRVPRTARGLLQQIGEALDNAIHGGDGGAISRQERSGGNRGFQSRSNPIPFPMVNPFKPVVETRSPVTALTAFPNRFTYKVKSEDGREPDDEQSSLDGLGFNPFDPGQGGWSGENSGISLPGSGSKLQTVLGTIQATLPATIAAFRASPQNIYPGSSYNPYAPSAQQYGQGATGGAVADVGAQAGAAVGNVGDTIGNIVAQHPYLVLAGGAALVLLFMSPPRRR